MTTCTAEATPRPGTVRSAHDAPCPAARPSDYPLSARCVCGEAIRCADGSASWAHRRASSR